MLNILVTIDNLWFSDLFKLYRKWMWFCVRRTTSITKQFLCVCSVMNDCQLIILLRVWFELWMVSESLWEIELYLKSLKKLKNFRKYSKNLKKLKKIQKAQQNSKSSIFFKNPKKLNWSLNMPKKLTKSERVKKKF